jgi:hypothetical protein
MVINEIITTEACRCLDEKSSKELCFSGMKKPIHFITKQDSLIKHTCRIPVCKYDTPGVSAND